MKTDDFIAALAADRRRGSLSRKRLLLMTGSATFLAGLLFVVFLDFRPDLATALTGAELIKTAWPLAFGVMSLTLAHRFAHPDARPSATLYLVRLAVVAGLCLYLLEAARQPLSAHGSAFAGSGLVICLPAIPLFGALPMAGALHALRNGASIDPGRTGLYAGLAAGSIGATLYSLACIDDSPLYFVPAYGIAIFVMGDLGRILGRRLLAF